MVALQSTSENQRFVKEVLPSSCKEVGRNFIGGEWKIGSESQVLEIINPTTGASLHRVSIASAEDVQLAVANASAASKEWWSLEGRERAATFWRVASGIREKAKNLGTLDTLDAGRPIRDTISKDVERAARLFEYFAGVTDRLRGSAVPVQTGMKNVTAFEPYGVVAAITPWNYPLTNAATKIAPALATGNAVVLKPAEDTPLSAMLLVEVIHSAGLPAGTLNLVNGPGETTGSALVSSTQVNKIAFTGSTEVGRRIAALAGENLQSVTLELGGKSPCIVFDDADLDGAVNAFLFSALANQGQTCTATSRLIISNRVKQTFFGKLRASASRVRVGDPLDPATHVGPVVSKRQRERVERYLASGMDEGAIRTDVEVDWRADHLNGFFVKPAFFSKTNSRMRVYREEIFGPIFVVDSFDTEEEAIALANDTEFGLAGSVWTESGRRGERCAMSIDAGLIWLNTIHSLHPGSPYGGFRQSGLGLEMGQEAVSQFMKTKSIWSAVDHWKSPWLQ